MQRILMWILMLVSVPLLGTAQTIDFWFVPDSSYGDPGDTVLLSARIGSSDTLRSFTIYIYNDTNIVDLAAPPTPGTLIAGRTGLDFRYQDHTPVAPTRLEVSATVFSTDFWAGPGELFRMRMVLRSCGDYVMPANVGFRRPDASYIPGNYNTPVFLICDRVPRSPSYLTVIAEPSDSVTLHWNAVTHDTLGRPLIEPPLYRVFREQLHPVPIPPALVGSTMDTVFVEGLSGMSCLYFVLTEVAP